MKNVLFFGASGYGNLGDDAYRNLFSNYLSDKFDLTFNSPYPNFDLVDKTDALVIGGGGLIYTNHSAHFSYMSQIMDKTFSQNKPVIFSSCGVQVVGFKPFEHKTEEEIIKLVKPQLACWKPYLEKAKLITVRSEMDVKILKSFLENPEIYYYPDLVYLIKPVPYHLIEKDSYVFIPTPSGHKLPRFQEEFMKARQDTTRKTYVACFSADDKDTTTFLGQQVNTNGHFAYRINLSPNEAAGILRDAYKVVSNRYHGGIIARAVGLKKENIVVVDTRYKSIVEDRDSDISLAINHILKLQEKLIS